ncbi:MAG: protein kinase [Planctomycetales bacterium]|nr:protein kinase [Planctomycetales bacterium]
MAQPTEARGPAPAGGFLADFGLAKSVATGSKLTRTGVALGTPAYMSPEQARGETASLTPATDVWSLGCVLHEMLSGRPPWEADTDAALVARILLERPAPLRVLRPDSPAGLLRVVGACFTKDTRRRYPGAGALRDDLALVLAGEAPLAPPRRTVTAAGVAFVLVAGAVALAALSARGPDGPVHGPPAGAPRSRPPGEDLAARAAAVRTLDPREGARLLGEALEAEPGRHAWRLERGILLWGIGDGEGARAAWRAVPTDAPQGPAARIAEALEATFDVGAPRDERTRRVAGAVQPIAAGGGREYRLARAFAAILREDWLEARALLRDEPGWDASLLRAYVEAWDPLGDRHAAIREYTRVLESGVPLAGVYTQRGALRGERGDLKGALEDCDAALRI